MEVPTWPGTEGDTQFNSLQGTESLEADPAPFELGDDCSLGKLLDSSAENLGRGIQLNHVWVPGPVETGG